MISFLRQVIHRVRSEQPVSCKIPRDSDRDRAVVHLIPRGLSGRKFMVTSG